MNWTGLRIAVIGPLPPPAGGMAGQTQQLVDLLRNEGADVTLVQTNPPYVPRWISAWRGVRAVPRLISYLVRLWAAAGRVQIFHVMANSGWSWHLFAVPAIWIGRLRGTPVAVNYRGGEARLFLERAVRWVRPSLRAASVLVVPSEFLVRVFGEFGFKGYVVPNIIDPGRFRPRPDKASDTGDTRTDPIILVPRNLEPIYDIGTALRAIALARLEVPDLKLVIAGSGPELPALRALAGELGIADVVTFAGRLGRDEMAERYSTAAIMLNPSKVDNMPNSVLEALASGVPIVSTDVGGVPFIVSHERTALLVPVGDDARMAAAIVRLLREPALAARLVEAGLIDAQRYTWPVVRETLGSLYLSLLASGSRDGGIA